MKFNKRQKEYLLNRCHESVHGIKQMEEVSSVILYTLNNKRISRKNVIDLIGEEAWLSGLHRASFHYTAMQCTKDNEEILFDARRYFK